MTNDQRTDDQRTETIPAKTWNLGRHAAAIQALRAAHNSMPGHAVTALLGELYQVARTEFGFEGTLDDAALLLQMTRDFRIEEGDTLEQARISLTSGNRDGHIE